jgi:hypothetical protein
MPGARLVSNRPLIELDGSANDLERLAAVGGFDLDDHVVDDRKLIAG